MATPHKFWRVVFGRSTSGSGASHDVWVGELSFRSAADSDLCIGGTPFSSGEYSAAYGTALAFDKNNTSNGWSSLQGQWPCWLGYEFAAPQEVASAVLTLPPGESASDELPVHGYAHLEYSDDGIAYTPLYFLGVVGTYTLGSEVRLFPIYEPSLAVTPGPLFARSGRAPTDFSQPRFVAVQPPQQASRPLALGPGRIAGTLKVLTLPAAREVRLHDRHTGQLLRTTTSAPDGTYTFSRLQLNRPYLVVGLDDTGQPSMYNAAVADMVEAGP